MKKHVFTALIIILCLVFIWLNTKHPPVYKVLEVYKGDLICVDLNRNNSCDKDEKVKIYGINAFPMKFGSSSKYLSKKYNLKEENIVVLGVMAKEFTQKELLDKQVEVQILDEKAQDYKIAKIFFDNIEYSKTMLKKGFATAIADDYVIFENMPSIKKNISFSKKFNYKLRNLKSGKIHTLDCEYGRKSTSYEIGIFDEKEYEEFMCGFCHNNHNKKSHKKGKSKTAEKEFEKFYDTPQLKVYFLDFTVRLKPDKNCGNKACKALLSGINNSKTSIDFALYGLGNIPEIETALRNAKKRGVKIRGVVDENNKQENIYERTKNLKTFLPNIKTDYISGQTVKFNNSIMHNKFFIFDDKTVWTGTANVSETDLSGYSSNNVIVINSPEVAKIYKTEFEKMYSGEFHNKKKSDGIKNVKFGETDIKIAFSPQDKVISSTIIPIIASAKENIKIEAFIITHKSFAKSLIDAQKRGVEVKIIADATSAKNQPSMIKFLRENGILVKVENYAGKMHQKTITVDGQYFISGSMNFTNSGEINNDENVVIIKNSGLVSLANEFFDYLWNKIPDKYLKRFVHAESLESKGSCYDGVDNNYDGKTDSQDERCIYKKNNKR